jgi:predicted RNA binding protein YcfA (HicA-like mRNA interferase family)
MTKLPVVKPSKVIKALKRAGFYIHHSTGSHYILKSTNDPTLRVVIPYHNKDLKTGTLAAIIKQTGMSVDDFRKLL